MRRNRRDSLRKERIIMVTSSAFVLAALTMTGLYMKGQEIRNQDDGYTLDFSALENSADKKLQEIQDHQQAKAEQDVPLPGKINMDNDLDYMPAEEVGSNKIEISGLTDGSLQEAPIVPAKDKLKEEEREIPIAEQEELLIGQIEENEPPQIVEERELHFSEETGLIRPVDGKVILPFSMDKSIYFQTLSQYKYHPATVYNAEEGTVVAVCAEGKVTDIFEDAQIGRGVTIDLGDGYQVTYGQLGNIVVDVDEYVNAGAMLGNVTAPTKYYSLEGPNLYFKVEKDGTPINPESLY